MRSKDVLPFFLFLFLINLFFGCTSVSTFVDPDGKVWTASVSGNAESKMKAKANGDIEMSIKRKPILKLPDLKFDDLRFGDE